MIVDSTDSSLTPPVATVTTAQITSLDGGVNDVNTFGGTPSNSSRLTQQQQLPSVVKQRNVVVQLDNGPSLTGEPYWVIQGPISSGGSRTVTWITAPVITNQQLFGMGMMSFYFSATPYSTYNDVKLNTPSWPNSTFNMTNLICSFWQDEGATNGYNIISKQTFYNFSGTAVYFMATLRTRILSN